MATDGSVGSSFGVDVFPASFGPVVGFPVMCLRLGRVCGPSDLDAVLDLKSFKCALIVTTVFVRPEATWPGAVGGTFKSNSLVSMFPPVD